MSAHAEPHTCARAALAFLGDSHRSSLPKSPPKATLCPFISCQRAELEPVLSGGLGRNRAERRGMQGQTLPSRRQLLGTRAFSAVQDTKGPGTEEQGTDVTLGRLGLGGSAPTCASASHSTAPVVACPESQILPLLPLPGAQHTQDMGALPAQGSSPPIPLLAEGEGPLWQKHLMELQQNRHISRCQESFSLTCTSLPKRLSGLQY